MSQVVPNTESRVEFDEASNNGVVLSNILIPEELISRIFTCYMDAKSLLNCQLVCKRWNIIINDYVWRKKATIRALHRFALEEPYDWKDYYIIYTKFGKNLLKNPSGAEDQSYRYWTILSSAGDGWKNECPPVGAPHLPDEPDFENNQYCFVTSYGTCSKVQTIDLLNEGFSANVLDHLRPTIQISEWYSCRYDCAATYEMTVRLLDSSDQTLDTFNFSDTLRDERQNVWHKVEHMFENYGQGLRRISFMHGGRDRRFWAGHYGSKMARATVKINNH